MFRHLSLFLSAALFSLSPAISADQITPLELVNQSPVIAVIEVSKAPRGQIDDVSLNLEVHKQVTSAKLIKIIQGILPNSFLLENEKNSILTDGRHLAFLKPLSEKRFILSTPFSLRRVKGDQAYWFENQYKNIREIAEEVAILRLHKAEQGAAANP